MKPHEAFAALPKNIKVGPHTYAVSIVDSITGDPDAYASFDPEAQTIEVLKTLASSTHIVGCIIHELLHAIWTDRDLGKRAGEEKVVLQYESALVQLFQDNPKLLTWIKRGLAK